MDAVFTILFGGILLVLAVWAFFLKRKADKFDHYVEKAEDLFDMSENRLQKVKDILCEMGCQPKLTTEEGGQRIEVAFQGETFLIAANDESAYICIWDYAWVVMELDDPRISGMEYGALLLRRRREQLFCSLHKNVIAFADRKI